MSLKFRRAIRGIRKQEKLQKEHAKLKAFADDVFDRHFTADLSDDIDKMMIKHGLAEEANGGKGYRKTYE